MKYLDYFMSLRSSGDILNVVNPLGNKAAKEITESIAVFQKLKRIALKAPMEYSLLDLCAGNALTSVLSVHVLPINNAVAVDKRPRNRNWYKARRFQYVQQSIMDDSIFGLITDKTIICAVHPCSGLAQRVADIYLKSDSQYLVMMPCCVGNLKIGSQLLRDKLGKYGCWCLELAEKVNGNIYQDEHCISPKNIIITAKKEPNVPRNQKVEYQVLDEDDGEID